MELIQVTIQRWTLDPGITDPEALKQLQNELTVGILSVGDPRVVRVQEESFVSLFD